MASSKTSESRTAPGTKSYSDARGQASGRQALIIGIGSPFSEDTLGWQLLDALGAIDWSGSGLDVQLIKADRPGVGLLDQMQGRDRVVLLDAVLAAEGNGSVVPIDRGDLARNDGRFSSHALGVAEVLDLGEKLGLLPRQLLLLGVVVGTVLDAPAVAQVEARIREFLSGADPRY